MDCSPSQLLASDPKILCAYESVLAMRDAILPAGETSADDLIVDDQRGRREAERRRLHTVGTLGVLQFASKKGLLDLREALGHLRTTSFYINDKLIERLIAETKP